MIPSSGTAWMISLTDGMDDTFGGRHGRYVHWEKAWMIPLAGMARMVYSSGGMDDTFSGGWHG